MWNKLKKENFLLLLSGSLIVIATMGFSVLQIYESQIDEIREQKENLQRTRDRRTNLLRESSNTYREAGSMRNHIQLLEELKSDSKKIKQRQDEYIILMKNTIFYAYSAALDPPTNEEMKEWKNLDTYPALFNVYYKYITKTGEKIIEVSNRILELNEQISRIKKTWRIVFAIMIFINSMGLVSGVISVYFKERKSNQSIPPVREQPR